MLRLFFKSSVIISSFLFLDPCLSQVYINEFLASNTSNITDPDYNTYSDWIEIFNAGNSTVDLTNWYLTDHAGSVPGWKFPNNTKLSAKGFLLIWADGRNVGLHTDFKLSASGEEVVLYDAANTQIDLISYSTQKTDISYGRKTDGSSTFGLFLIPSPGKPNSSSRFYDSSVAQVPVFSKHGGFYPSAIQIEIKDLYQTGTIKYTLDGSDPSETSTIYTKPLNISTTTVVRAKMFYTNQIPGPTITNTYFINEKFEERKLPVLSLSTHPSYFYNKDTGLYVQNFKPTWEYPIHLEFYQKDEVFGFHHDAGVQIGGLNAWILPQKLLNIYSRKKYGSSSLPFQLFEKNKRNVYGDFALRCSGNDWSNTFFRDGMMQALIKDYADLDGQDFRPISIFFDGKYLGMQNIREKQDESYCLYYHNINPDSLDYIENNVDLKNGSFDTYNQLIEKLNSGVQSDESFDNLHINFDVVNFTDYIISQIFSANTSWGHNISCFRDRGPTGKWRWLLHDYDRGFDLANVNNTGMSWATATNGAAYSNPAWATLFLRKLLENAKFKQSFITRFADHLYITYHPKTIRAKVDYHYNLIKNEMPYQIERWKGTTSSYGDAIPTYAFWLDEVNKLRLYGDQRNTFMWTDLNSYFNLSGTTTLRLDVSHSDHGFIKLHDIKVPSYPWTGNYFQNRSIDLTAIAKPGFNFIRWEKISISNKTILLTKSKWKYSDKTIPPPTNWIQTNFDDSSWSIGNAELGYGDGDETTLLNYGPDPNNKTPSYYFRSSFNIVDKSLISDLLLKIKIDDGAVIYINGKELDRINMPAFPALIGFDTLALISISGAVENTYNELAIPLTYLINGVNSIAVEVHQSARSSSDLSFDAELISQEIANASVVSTVPLLTTTLNSSPADFRAVFESNGNCGILPDSILTNTVLKASCSPYFASQNVVVKQGVSLSAEPGVEIRFPEKANLIVQGDLQFIANSTHPILITSLDSSSSWGGIFIDHSTDTCRFNYVQFKNSTAGVDRTYFPATLSAYSSNVLLDHLEMTQVKDNPIFARFSHVELSNSNIQSFVTGDCINVKQGTARVENCNFKGGDKADMDGVDYDGVKNGIIRNNVIHDFRGSNADGLDIGEECKDLIIENNFIYHCFDKGISVGQQSSVHVRDNVIAYTTIGIAIKDQSQANIDHCTFFGNKNGVDAYEKNAGYLGGNGIVTNCIVSNASTNAYVADAYSGISVQKCLSDLDSSGTTQGDIIADPVFKNPTLYDFQLKPSSKGIGAGSDGQNLGALTFPNYKDAPQIMFSEILYDDSLSLYPEFVEIYNPGKQTIDLTGYVISSAVDFVFPNGVVIKPKEAIVITKGASKFNAVSYQVFEWTNGKLRNEGEIIELYDKNGILVDFVNYNNKFPWPLASQSLGKSIEIKSDDLDNHFGTSWKFSNDNEGSPGVVSFTTNYSTVQNGNIQIVPNPASDLVKLQWVHVANPRKLFVYDELGRKYLEEDLKNQTNLVSLNVQNFQPGVYIIKIVSEEGRIFSNRLCVTKN